MQPGKKSVQFERAQNEIDLGPLGDPERWGGVADISIDVPSQTEVWSEQILRVQCADLIARSWNLIVAWHLEGFRLGDDFSRCGFELTIGVGQASRRMVLDLTASLQGYPAMGGIAPGNGLSNAILPVAWEVTPWGVGYADGVVTLPWGIPAVALAGRFVLGIIPGGLPTVADGGSRAAPAPAAPILGHTIFGSCWAAVCPRSL